MTNWKWILLNISLHLNCLKFIVLQIQFRYIVTNVLFINVHSDYEENSFKNQYCFIETSLTWNDAKVRCVLYSNNLPISFFSNMYTSFTLTLKKSIASNKHICPCKSNQNHKHPCEYVWNVFFVVAKYKIM